MPTTATLVRPLTARSVVLSLLLGTHSPRLPVRHILTTGELFGISPATMRVALTRLVQAGDLVADQAVYALSPRHLERHRLQELELDPVRRPWDGTWETVVVTATGRDAATRADLRRRLTARRLVMLREGVWMRPDNLPRDDASEPDTLRLLSHPDDPAALTDRLWDLQRWADTGSELLDVTKSGDTFADRFTAAAALVRHLRTDPALPDELLPGDWPGAAMRQGYEDFRTEIKRLRPPEGEEL
jgi:phenylacetic acid degradation operon negative regulatory protein